MRHTRMERHPGVDVIDPRPEDVMAMMDRLLSDDDEPCIVLRGEITTDAGTVSSSTLMIARLNHLRSGDPVAWLVDFREADRRKGFALARSTPKGDRHQCEFFGGIENIRVECLLKKSAVEPAVRWFLEHGGADPSLTWLDLLDSLRDS